MPAVLTAAALAACAAAQGPQPAPACDPVAVAWRGSATAADRRRLRDWRQAWTEALDQARAGGHADEIAREGALLEPDAALPEPAPPPGDYDCRTIKLGTPSPDLLVYVSYPAFRCRIAVVGERMAFTKLSGSQRPIGRLYPDVGRRLVFLGTLQLGDERRSHQYGIDEERDMIGLVERIGEQRWRLVLPYPHFESLLDVIELTPAAPR